MDRHFACSSFVLAFSGAGVFLARRVTCKGAESGAAEREPDVDGFTRRAHLAPLAASPSGLG